MRLVQLATATLNQWALDFGGNRDRTLQSVKQARQQGASYRVGPELELCGYGCEDHFLEPDTETLAWASLAHILADESSNGILLDIGGLATHAGARYNVRIFCLNGRILLIRPKCALANDGNYRESRYFQAWNAARGMETFFLPDPIRRLQGQTTAPFGHAILQLDDATIAAECCEELFTPCAPHGRLAIAGVDIVSNGSGSHHELRKQATRLDLIKGATSKSGGVYMYSNQRGCDGGRLYYDGCSLIAVNGAVVAQGLQFALSEVEVVTACVDLDDVTAFRGARASAQTQSASVQTDVSRIVVPFQLRCESSASMKATKNMSPALHIPEEEIALGPACWLWDYLRRSGAGGFLLPLSGGADSAAVAAICGSMFQLVEKAVDNGDVSVERDALRLARLPPAQKVNSRALASKLLTTVYMAYGSVSSDATRARARALAKEIGSTHIELDIQTSVETMLQVAVEAVGCEQPRFKAHGGSSAESLALQNLQARTRMVLAFLLAQLQLTTSNRSGFKLILGSSNVDEALRGYFTKFDCSAADLNPIGSISKHDLSAFLKWGATALNYPTLLEVATATPTAELEPCSGKDSMQTDEKDMGMTYAELSAYGKLRSVVRCGPLSMFNRLAGMWSDSSPGQIASKVKHFWKSYSQNRHKMTSLTPAYHAEAYSPDDNRYDHRPFLYCNDWADQFGAIDARVSEMQKIMQQGNMGNM